MKIEVNFAGNKKVNAIINDFTIKTDQAKQNGGDGTAPEPFALFLSSLATCAGIYIKNFCDTRKLSAENIKLYQSIEFNAEKRMIGKINIEIHVPSDFPDKYDNGLKKTAGLCAVKKHLHPEIEVNTIVVRA